MAATRSPALKLVTPSPTASTTPAVSAPGIKGNGGLTWYLPWTCRISKKLRAQALFLIRTSPALGDGSSTLSSTIDSGSPQACTRQDFISSARVLRLLHRPREFRRWSPWRGRRKIRLLRRHPPDWRVYAGE